MASAYRIGPYCRAILTSTDNIRKPIYTWDCFNLKYYSVQDLEAYVNEIADALRTYDISEELTPGRNAGEQFSQEVKIYAILFLIRCALIARLADDWMLTLRPEYSRHIGLTVYFQGIESKLIAIGERGLSRNPIESDSENQPYTLRIAAEAGFPLRSLQRKDSKAARGLRSIYSLHSSSLPKSDQLRVVSSFVANCASIRPDSSYFWMPGGKTGAREFYTQGSTLLNQISFRKKQDESLSEIEILRQLGFIDPSEEVVDYIFKNPVPLNTSFASVRPTLVTAPQPAKIIRPQNKNTPTDWTRSNSNTVVSTKINSLGLKVKIIRPKNQW